MSTAARPRLRPGTTDRVMARLFPKDSRWVDDPNGWARERGLFLWSGQRKINDSVVEHRYTAVRSCHGIGKSFDAALLVNWWLDSHKPGEAFVVTSAPTGRQVYAILWRYIRRLHRSLRLSGRITLDADYYMDIDGADELVGYGRKPADWDPAAFQGIHARYVLVILDEAGGIPKSLYDATDSLVTSPGSRVLGIGNPDDPNSHFKHLFRPGSAWNRIKISAYDSPAFTGEKIPQWLAEELVTREWVEERRQDWGESSPLFKSKVEAEFPEVSDDALISMSDLTSAVNLDREDGSRTEVPGVFGGDVARFGPDESVLYHNRDGIIRRHWVGHKASTMETAGQFKSALQGTPRASFVVIDADGVGGGVVDRLIEQGMDVVPFHGGARAWESEKFVNLRSEMFWSLRKAFEDREIDIDEEDLELIGQLSSIKFKVTSSGKIAVETKDEMRKRGLKSPDRADAVMMSRFQATDLSAFFSKKGRETTPDLTSDLLERPL